VSDSLSEVGETFNLRGVCAFHSLIVPYFPQKVKTANRPKR
jgi:hypothetical protein